MEYLGFTQCMHDPCLFSRGELGDRHFILIYVDDLLLAALQLGIIDEIIGQMSKNFTLTTEELGHYLGMDICYDR